MNRETTQNGEPAPSTRDLLDAYFDGDLDRAGKGQLHEALRHDPLLAEEFSRTSEAVSLLRQSASNTGLEINLADRVLTRCDSTRGYLNKRSRRFVLAGRTAVALAALALTAGVVLFVRLTPPELRLPENQRPLSALIEGGSTDAASLRLVPPNVHQELSDSVDQSKAERTIVFNLEADSADSFAPFRSSDSANELRREMARLPMFARQPESDARRAVAMGPLLMDGRQASSVVRSPEAHGWWSRDGIGAGVMMQSDRERALWLIFRLDEPWKPDADSDQE